MGTYNPDYYTLYCIQIGNGYVWHIRPLTALKFLMMAIPFSCSQGLPRTKMDTAPALQEGLRTLTSVSNFVPLITVLSMKMVECA